MQTHILSEISSLARLMHTSDHLPVIKPDIFSIFGNLLIMTRLQTKVLGAVILLANATSTCNDRPQRVEAPCLCQKIYVSFSRPISFFIHPCALQLENQQHLAVICRMCQCVSLTQLKACSHP